MKFSTLLAGLLLLLLFVPVAGRAAPCDPKEFGDLEAPLPNIVDKSICALIDTGSPLTTYAQSLIDYFIAFIVAAGLIMIVIAGYMYMTAGGDGSRVGTAKTMITSALLGIALALAAYTILYTIGGNQFFREPTFSL